MVRKHKRKSEKLDSSVLVRALQAIDTGMSIRAAARDFDIPETTLRRHSSNNRGTPVSDQMETESVTSNTSATSASTTASLVPSAESQLVLTTSNEAQSVPSTSHSTFVAGSEKSFEGLRGKALFL